MENDFKPMKASSIKKTYKDILMRGDGIRVDAGGHDFYDIIPRNKINSSEANHNVGMSHMGLGPCEFERLEKARDAFYELIDELKKEDYVVEKKHCDGSGFCQYSATIYYIK